MEISTLPAEKADIDGIFKMAKELVDTYEDLTTIDYDKVLHWMYRKISDQIDAYTCVYADGDKIGYYHLMNDQQSTEIDDFYLLPSFRNMGYGSQILHACIQQAASPMFLYVFRDNAGAIRFYERHGFQIAEQVSPTRYIMRRSD